jgi:hypothetical protein
VAWGALQAIRRGAPRAEAVGVCGREGVQADVRPANVQADRGTRPHSSEVEVKANARASAQVSAQAV